MVFETSFRSFKQTENTYVVAVLNTVFLAHNALPKKNEKQSVICQLIL